MIGCEKCDGWFHGECIGLDEADAQQIKKWYCFDCCRTYNLKVVFFTETKTKKSHKKTTKPNKKITKSFPKKNKENEIKNIQQNVVTTSYERKRDFCCGQCSNCLQNEECGNKDGRMFFKKRLIQQFHNNKEMEIGQNFSRNQELKMFHKPNERQASARIEQRCLGLNCSKFVRVNSKYCSDDCGMALAKARLLGIVKDQAKDQLTNPGAAYQKDTAKLEEIKNQKEYHTRVVQKLNIKEHIVRRIIESTKRLQIIENEAEIADDSKIHCVCCGWEIPNRSYVKHVENCFRKAENQNIVESFNKSNTPFCNIFCDHYNASRNTYCSRLRYLCPSHFKIRKSRDDEVCGCPIVNQLTVDLFFNADKFCQRQKNLCTLHFNWEILAISEVDTERLRELIKLNSLIKEEGEILSRMANRRGVLGLLLNSSQEHK
ncbi:CXXC-type zinc finger protein 1-like [Macrosteles quadrilineatus]|uniref:CXXC-type zinc finger protein 1-like n=1 Tax=Macrosteles quadrilineatus TaxID=74068 RepID=UPI0023E142A4|nr:CXXC-type zinc finger protein 1-like [Macrosteles quadrilineatus]